MRSFDEPYLCVKSDYIVKKRGVDGKYPALWVSSTDPEMMIRKRKDGDYDLTKPDLHGLDIVRVVRDLMKVSALPLPPVQGLLL